MIDANAGPMDTEARLVMLSKKIFDEYFIGLPDWDLEFIISILNNISYRRNKIKWDEQSKKKTSEDASQNS